MQKRAVTASVVDNCQLACGITVKKPLITKTYIPV